MIHCDSVLLLGQTQRINRSGINQEDVQPVGKNITIISEAV